MKTLRILAALFVFGLAVTTLSADTSARERAASEIAKAVASGANEFEVTLGTLSPKDKPPAFSPKPLKTSASASLPVIILFQSGFNSLLNPDSGLLEIYETFTSYFAGEKTYMNVVLANYEATSQRVSLVFTLAGPVNHKYKVAKRIPARTVKAFFIKVKLSPNDIGTYGFDAAVFAGKAIDANFLMDRISFFYISDVF